MSLLSSTSHPFLFVFLALNLLFLIGTAIWFRVDHASSPKRFEPLIRNETVIIDEVMWQYSLRSNLLLFGCIQSAYLLYMDQVGFVLGVFVLFSVINLITDTIYKYDSAPGHSIAVNGHRIAASITLLVGLLYYVEVV